MDEAQRLASWDDCLLTDQKMKTGPYSWQLLPDPFSLGNARRADHSSEA
jgi:hypothetical protein